MYIYKLEYNYKKLLSQILLRFLTCQHFYRKIQSKVYNDFHLIKSPHRSQDTLSDKYIYIR